ncbi:hypothetical protein [Chryseobacterium wanjuense]
MKKIRLLLPFSVLSVATFGQVGINTSNPQGIFNIDAAKDNATTGVPTTAQQANDFTVMQNGSIGIGTTAPHPSAILDITSTNKGILAPRIALSSRTDATTIANPAVGLLVYNLGTIPSFTYKGYVFWNGTEWRSFDNSSLDVGTVGALTCNSVSLTPNTYASGVPYTGTMSIPYTGGNGGVYQAQTIGTCKRTYGYIKCRKFCKRLRNPQLYHLRNPYCKQSFYDYFHDYYWRADL